MYLTSWPKAPASEGLASSGWQCTCDHESMSAGKEGGGTAGSARAEGLLWPHLAMTYCKRQKPSL